MNDSRRKFVVSGMTAGGLLLASPLLKAQVNCNGKTGKGTTGGGGCGGGGGNYDFSMFNHPAGLTSAQSSGLIAIANKSSINSGDLSTASSLITSAAMTLNPTTCPQTNVFNAVNYNTLLSGVTTAQLQTVYNAMVTAGYTQTFTTFQTQIQAILTQYLSTGLSTMVSMGTYQFLLAVAASLTSGGDGAYRGQLGADACTSLAVTSAGIALAGAVLAVFPATAPAALGYGIIAGTLFLIHEVSCQ